MGYKRRTSFFEDLISLAAMIPWWLNLILAAASYLYLSNLTVASPTAIDPKDIASTILSQLLVFAVLFGQYLVPAVFLIGGFLSFLGALKRKALVNKVRKSEKSDPFNSISWHDFELLVGQYYKENGYKVVETGGVADGGIDLRLTREGETYLVQCKHWKTGKVPVTVVRELYGAMAAEGAAGAFVVTSGKFTADAEAFARGKNIELVDGRLLASEIRQVSPPQPVEPAAPLAAAAAAAPASLTTMAHNTAACPLCQSEMVRRVAKKGPAAGTVFYGCSRFPKCRGIRQI